MQVEERARGFFFLLFLLNFTNRNSPHMYILNVCKMYLALIILFTESTLVSRQQPIAFLLASGPIYSQAAGLSAN